jgi:pyrophosphatase PpaX
MSLIFDLDGTLIDSARFHAHFLLLGIDKVLGKGRIPASFVNENIIFPSSIFFKEMEKHYHVGLTSVTMHEIISAKDAGITRDAVRKVKFFPFVKQLLRFLKTEGIGFCMATSMNDAELAFFSSALNLRYFSRILVNSHSFRSEKPRPYILNEALKESGFARERTYYVGDSPYDLLASKRAKLKFLGVNNRKLKAYGNFVGDIKGLYERITSDIAAFR